MRDYIAINKNLIPYSFDILLGAKTYTLTVKYNETSDLFVVELKCDGVAICSGEPLIYGHPLFSDCYMVDKFPSVTLVPYDESGEEQEITFQNLNETVFLTMDDEGSG